MRHLLTTRLFLSDQWAKAPWRMLSHEGSEDTFSARPVLAWLDERGITYVAEWETIKVAICTGRGDRDGWIGLIFVSFEEPGNDVLFRLRWGERERRLRREYGELLKS